ncbi:MAG: hypothetical protein PHE24_05730 [Patescibacteria group bacterium]|nr:hypothetical protein [Patescibacteria group bacterium]
MLKKAIILSLAVAAIVIVSGKLDKGNLFNIQAAYGYGGSVSVSYCSSVVYGDWKACASGYQYRDVLSQLPTYCQLTATQQAARTAVCGQTANVTTPSTPENVTTPAANVLTTIANEATLISADNTPTLLTMLGTSIDANKAQANLVTYKSIFALDNQISSVEKTTVNDFITYGTPSTLKLGAGERAGVVNSYFQAFKKMPVAESGWSDILKIANGRWPGETSAVAENQAKVEFKKVYGRNPVMTNTYDSNAVTIISYGLIPAKRNLASEKVAINTFRHYYGYAPSSALAWNVVRAIAYSGAKR